MGGMVKAAGWLATFPRIVAIGIVALLSVVAYTAGSIRRLVIFDRERRAEHRARQRGRLLRWSFARLGATFIKVGQVMSSRPDLFSPPVIEELRWLQDRVPPFPFRQVRQVIERELRSPLAHHFREFDAASIAAGSVAQVHHAVLTTGEEVAVKVLRPGVIARTRRDGRILLWLAHLAYAISPRARTADVVGHVRNLVAGILAQTNLRYERQNYEQFRRNFGDTPGIYFPRVYRKHSTRSMLTMEYVHGRRLDDALSEHLPQAAQVIRHSFFAMCFEHGFVHADLHPGNILLRDDGVVVLIDVGLVKRLSRDLLDQMVDFTRCIAAGTGADLVAHLRRYHRYLASTDWDAVAADIDRFVAYLRKRPIVELELSAVIGELFALARKHKIRPLPEMIIVLLGMVTNEGMAKRLDPKADTLAELARFLGPRLPGKEDAHRPARRRMARGSRSWSKAALDAGRLTLPTLEVKRPRPPLIVSRYLAGRSVTRKLH